MVSFVYDLVKMCGTVSEKKLFILHSVLS